MKFIKIYIATLIFTLSGCSEEFLDRQSLTDLSSDTFWTSEADATMGLMGCYSALQDRFLFDSDPWTGGIARMDYMTDDGYTSWQWMAGGEIPRGEHNSTSWMIGDTWRAAYRAISQCNLVIARVPDIEGIDQAVASQIVAEAKVIRATVYNILAMTYHDVPLITEPLEVQDAKVAKRSQADIFDFITTDVAGIVSDLPLPSETTGSNFGRINQGAALGMLARIYLYNSQFSEAAAAAKQVIDLSYYSLADDYKSLFSVSQEQNTEVVFSVAFDRFLDNGSAFAGFWWLIDYHRVLPNLAEDFYCTDGLASDVSLLYDVVTPSANRDPRFDATMVSNNANWQGAPLTGEEGNYYQRKYAEEENYEDHFDSPQDFYVLRYADILLMRAEALVQSGTYTESEVIGLIDQVRGRVGMPLVGDVEGTGLGDQALLDVIKHERRVELAFEGLRYFDLVRWEELDDKYEYYMANEYQVLQDQGYPEIRPRTFVSYRWPLPQGDLDVNENLVQHDEW